MEKGRDDSIGALLVKTVGHFFNLQRGVVIGQLEIDLSRAMNGTGIPVIQIDLEPAVQGYLSRCRFIPPQCRYPQGNFLC